MKRRFVTAMVVIVVSIFALYFLFSFPGSPLENIVNPSPEGGNDTNPWTFPKITFPWSAKEPEGSPGGSGGSGGESDDRGLNGGNGTRLPVIKNRYTLFVNSTHDLEVLVLYSANSTVVNETKSLPFSLEVEEYIHICLVETTGSGTIRWLIDNEIDCPFSDCGRTLYDCDILMDRNHSIVLRQYS